MKIILFQFLNCYFLFLSKKNEFLMNNIFFIQRLTFSNMTTCSIFENIRLFMEENRKTKLTKTLHEKSWKDKWKKMVDFDLEKTQKNWTWLMENFGNWFLFWNSKQMKFFQLVSNLPFSDKNQSKQKIQKLRSYYN